MKIKDMSKEEIEMISYDDLAYMILNETNKKMTINVLFEEVCKIKGLSQDIFEQKIADFFQVLSTEKRFVMLENGKWDLTDRHSKKIVIDEDDDDDDFVELEEEPQDEEETPDFDEVEETDDLEEDDLKDLAVIDPEENNEIE